MINILKEITRQRDKRNWTEYELAKRADLTQSTISNWYRRGQLPTIAILDKVCNAFGITLSQFFAESDDCIALTPEQRQLLDDWSALTSTQQQIIKELLANMNASPEEK